MEAAMTRTTVAKREPEAMRAFEEAHARYTAAALDMARALETIDRSAAFIYEKCSNLEEWAERRKFAGQRARVLRELAAAMRLNPGFEEMVRRHEATIEGVAAVGSILHHPQVASHVDHWVERVKSETTRDVIEAVRKQAAELRVGQTTFTARFRLTHDDIVGFRRARKVACRKNGKTLSWDEAFRYLVQYFLKHEDPLWVKPGKRRMPDTTGAKKGDFPAEVKREVEARTGGKCAIATCDNDIYTQRAHLCPRCKGGGFEAWCTCELCWPHHQDYDAGRLFNVGTADKPIFVTEEGTVIGGRVKRPLPGP
jgi:hypothetical protein